MQVKVNYPSKTEAIVTVVSSEAELKSLKDTVLLRFQDRVAVPGFRKGNVPPAILEKNVDPNILQTEFLEEALEQLYTQSIRSQKLRPVERPEVAIKKFVPFTLLEFEAKVSVVSDIKLADYKKIKLPKPAVSISAKDVEEVIKSLQTRAAEKIDVDRPAKNNDQAWIDFKGVDTKGVPVNGAEGKDYPLLIGSKAFIPGFEGNIIGMKANDEKTFDLTFPKDYGVKALANKKVTFTVTLTKVQEVKEPKVDDDFVAKIGPFKSVADLKTDIKKQLTTERQQEADRAYESEIIKAVSAKSSLEIPKMLVDDQLERMEQEERQNLTYRGQTWQEHLDEEGTTEEKHREKKRPEAEERIKASLVLAEIAELEKQDVTQEELETRIGQLKQQYQDPQMQSELDKPENRRDIAGRILTEKTLLVLVAYCSNK